MNGARVIPIRQIGTEEGRAHARMRVFQVFVNVEGIQMRKRGIMRIVSQFSRRRHGFYAVMLVAAEEGSLPPLLLSLVRDTLMEAFEPLSFTPPESWLIKLVDWRMVGMAPPMFQEPGCVDQDWGAAWYDMADDKARQHRHRLTKRRLWEGRRAKARPAPRRTEPATAADSSHASQSPAASAAHTVLTSLAK